jgi:hypothetical protein
MKFGSILAAVGFALALVPSSGRADDYGPRVDLRAIRLAVPVLVVNVTSRLWRVPGLRVDVDDVVVNANDAVATWHVGTNHGLVVLRRRSNLWWITGNAYQDSNAINSWRLVAPGEKPICMDPYYTLALTTHALQVRLGVPSDLARLVRDHIIAVASTTDLETRHDPSVADNKIWASCYSVAGDRYIYPDAGYVATLSERLPENITMHARAPTEGEMPPTRGANSYYFFSVRNTGTAVVQFANGLQLGVWCPFVLDPNLRYTLTIAGIDPTVGPVDGSLRDNELNFNLPAFAAPPGVELMGEIEGNPLIRDSRSTLYLNIFSALAMLTATAGLKPGQAARSCPCLSMTIIVGKPSRWK